MKKLFIGIDISKDTLDVCFIESSSELILFERKVNNTKAGLRDVLERLTKLGYSGSDAWFCFEHTGTYGYLLAYLLNEKGICYSAVPGVEIKRSIGLARGANDTIDARRIALYACRNHKKLQPTTFPSEAIMKIKSCLSCRNHFVKISTQLKNSLHSYKIANKVVDNQMVIAETIKQLESINSSIKQLEKTLTELFKQDEGIYKNFKLISSVIGVGPIIAAHMIVYTANFQSFPDARKFNCYAGIAPFSKNSGTSIHTKPRVNGMANKRIKKLLSNGANSAAHNDPELKTYYVRKIEEGKNHNSVMNAICCKIVARMFAVVNRQTEFVSIYSHSCKNNSADNGLLKWEIA